jgi:hypothetical protein
MVMHDEAWNKGRLDTIALAAQLGDDPQYNVSEEEKRRRGAQIDAAHGDASPPSVLVPSQYHSIFVDDAGKGVSV